ncbi:hypothetical protein [Elizabethkingia meningoseptica]|uniref:hypothetical protein n=1 Tax=Elizabethkingia meningoseptica TaxID=238 RepID=UPI0023B1C02B|nr:hypothetical protein [Elizabethkingia meningoseptica]MDE5525703.1 hypothetical protein [Elizabethkingia meningoseptica]
MEAIVLHNQSLLDVVLQATGGTIDTVSHLVANNVSITDALGPGSIIALNDPNEDVDVKNYYSAKVIQPATAIKDEKINYPEGIDFWSIEGNFVIS